MTTEEKQEHIEALARAIKCLDEERDTCFVRPDVIFPELKENEDERIKGAIIHFISHTPTVPKGIINKEEMLAWLKKQGKHKDYYTKQELIDMGFSFTLNGDIVTPDKMMEDMKKYLAWKEKQRGHKVWTDNDYDKIKSIEYLLHEIDNHNFDDWFNSLKK